MIDRSTSRLDQKTELLLSILKESPGEWLTRSDIARALDKRKLSPYDIAMLEILEDRGLIEIQHRGNRTPIGYEFVYRATDRA